MNELQPTVRHPVPASESPANSIDVTPLSIQLPGPGLKRDYAGILEYWQMIRRHKGAVVLATFLGCLAGFLVTLSDPRIYQARTTLEIQGLNEEFLNMKNVNPVSETNGGYLDTDIQTQVKILQSRALLARVKDKLDARPHPDNLQPADRLGAWRKALKMNPPSSEQLWAEALGTAAGGVKVRSSGTNRIVDVSCDSTSGQLAADFCNVLTREYIDQNLEARWKTTEYTGEWLTRQLRDLKIKLEKQEEELQSYARATGLVFTAEKNDVQEATLADLQKELSDARADRIAKQSKYEMAETSPAGALPDVLDDLPLKDTQRSLADLQAKLAELQVTFTSSHSEVKRVRAQINAIEASLEGSRTNILTRIRKEYEAAGRREALLAKAYADQTRLLSGKAEETAHYNLLKRDVDATRLLYETLLQRLKEASIASALRATNVRVVDAAEPPTTPYKPNVTQRGTVGLLFGLVLGVVFAVLHERADRTLQDPGDVSYYLGVPELGVVPLGGLFDGPRPKNAFRSSTTEGPLKSAGFDSRVEMISFRQKTSLLAESFRTTLTSILFSRRSSTERPRLLVLTSASPKEGKTTVVCNLGISLAEINQRVLVIDGDMRRPRIHSVFDVANKHGLSDLLLEKAPLNAAKLEAACVQTMVPGLYVLPSGGSRHHASSLLHSPRLAELLHLARESFDTVVVDTPPMVNIADARVVARFGDALILIVRSGVTTRDAAQLAKARFAEDGTPVLGTILNFWNPRTPGYSYYKYYYAGYYHYYGDGSRKGDGNGNGNGSGPCDDDAPAGVEPTAEWAMSVPGFALRRQLGDGDGRVSPEREK
jgi:succinoglycan biosynthesis transport protein ExoP